MFRKAVAASAILLVGGCSSQIRDDSFEIRLIDFQVLGTDSFSGILAVSEFPISRAYALQYQAAIRGFVFVHGSPPHNLNACFYIDNVRYGLTHVDKSATGSIRFDLEKYPDAGVAYEFQVATDGSVSGTGGFWSGTGDDSRATAPAAIVGSYRWVSTFDECTNKFPANET